MSSSQLKFFRLCKSLNLTRNYQVLQTPSGWRHFSSLGKQILKPVVDSNDSQSKERTSGTNFHNDNPGIPTIHLKPFQKRYLLLALKHKSIHEIPDELSVAQINTLYVRARITLNLILAGCVLILCVITVSLGKSDSEKGVTIEKINLDWHQKIKADNANEQEQSKAGRPAEG
ncbi:uncharacterized protein LOC108669160 [Hyalella azteca]|uniref:Uncharacterized protein LOC108669160 n=1 Tax=Hyalella azteca TaxID=294128 RepID=A0A8B7NEB6_HYAAZ|nr:uncharacterized protein LOC108669160 [Hyalella azteca]